MAKRRCATKNHTRSNKFNCFCLYTVYDEKNNGLPIIVDGTAEECAKLMGITKRNFYIYMWRLKKGLVKRWFIEQRYIDESGEIYEEMSN